VEFRTDKNNARSIAALKSIGSQVEGTLRNNYKSPKGDRSSSVVLSIIKEDWVKETKANMKMKFREGTIEDVTQLKKLALSAYGEFEKELTTENWNVLHGKQQSENSYINLLKISTCFVCEVDDNLVGVAYIILSGHPTEIFEVNWSYIRMVGVEPAYRGHGIAKQLTKHCIEYAKQNGETIIALHTSEMMDAAIYIYEKMGFKQIKELQPIFGKRYWLYHLNLNDKINED